MMAASFRYPVGMSKEAACLTRMKTKTDYYTGV